MRFIFPEKTPGFSGSPSDAHPWLVQNFWKYCRKSLVYLSVFWKKFRYGSRKMSFIKELQKWSTWLSMWAVGFCNIEFSKLIIFWLDKFPEDIYKFGYIQRRVTYMVKHIFWYVSWYQHAHWARDWTESPDWRGFEVRALFDGFKFFCQNMKGKKSNQKGKKKRKKIYQIFGKYINKKSLKTKALTSRIHPRIALCRTISKRTIPIIRVFHFLGLHITLKMFDKIFEFRLTISIFDCKIRFSIKIWIFD